MFKVAILRIENHSKELLRFESGDGKEKYVILPGKFLLLDNANDPLDVELYHFIWREKTVDVMSLEEITKRKCLVWWVYEA
jgi:hypothetical protein